MMDEKWAFVHCVHKCNILFVHTVMCFYGWICLYEYCLKNYLKYSKNTVKTQNIS